MFKRFLFIACGLFIMLACLGNSFASASFFDFSEKKESWTFDKIFDFKPSIGDVFAVDIDNGVGYLVNEQNKHFSSFPVLTGQRRNVCYLRSCYYAATPEQKWIIKEENIQTDRVTFSDSGEFFRLYYNGESTHYGVHGYKYFKEEIAKGTKFLSMGCVLVEDSVLDVIENSFVVNSKELAVYTIKSIPFTSMMDLRIF